MINADDFQAQMRALCDKHLRRIQSADAAHGDELTKLIGSYPLEELQTPEIIEIVASERERLCAKIDALRNA